ncbi:MAG: tRNA (guanosine(46)-N7)-methyltransferase TrmB [Clostridia bacterium]|nr:tRNA (guanosine(46)-N7)-methyltransferase TrmB [Clostridia bacterium]
MHMRTKKWAKPELAACPYYLDEPFECRGNWRSKFVKDQPLYVELGCGKGVSTAQMVFDQQDRNFVAVDITSNVLGDARRNIEKLYGSQPVENVILSRFDISRFDEFFAGGDAVGRIYINFCNPWTKRPKYAKRRLTHTRQLMQYRHALADDGEIWFKTDDDTLFEESIPCFEESGFELITVIRDLAVTDFKPNYISEHEQMYRDMNVPIKFLVARMHPLDEAGQMRHDAVIEEVSRREKSERQRKRAMTGDGSGNAEANGQEDK